MSDTGGLANEKALAELASETERAFDQAVDATAELARGKTVSQVDVELQAELRRRGIDPTNTAEIAEQIVAALTPQDDHRDAGHLH